MLDSLESIPEIGKKSKSEILEIALDEFLQRHLASQNPQTTLDKTVKAIPNLFEIMDHPEVFDKYYKLLNAKETDYMAKMIDALTAKHLTKKKRFE